MQTTPDEGIDERPATDDRAPCDVVDEMVDHVTRLINTWSRWDGRPARVADRVYTPHKAARRLADHLLDHLAEIDARLAGVPTVPDHWHASAVTTPADLTTFTPHDRDEALSRLERLALMWRVRLRSLSDDLLDHRPAGAWTIREIAFHVAESRHYAEAVGDLDQSPVPPVPHVSRSDMPIIHVPAEPTHTMGGNRFTSVATPSTGSTDTAVWYVEIPPDSVPTPHSLTREEVFVVLEGTACVAIADRQGMATAGDAIVVPAGNRFELTNGGATALRLLCCMPVGGKAQLVDGTLLTPPWAE